MKEITPQTGVARRIDRACRHVSDLWFPANPRMLSELRDVLSDDSREAPLDAALDILEGDFSLFMFAMKEVLRMVSAEGIALPDFASPREILEKAGVDGLKAILNDAEEKLSAHRLDNVETEQLSRMREAMVSASASATLAEAQLENKELGFFAGLLRQLGLTLIAFNYPGVYQRATRAAKEGTSLDQAISDILGFSPATLAGALAKQWELPTGLCSLLSDGGNEHEELEREMEVNALGNSLRELCRVGEALSRANEPSTYPTAQADWEFARQEITKRLGPAGLATIREAIENRFEHLMVDMPSFFRGGTILDPEAFLARHREDQMGAHNPLLKACRLHVQERILELYHGLAEGQSTQALLRKFSQVTVPNSGFSGGAVYTVDPSTLSLTPQLQIGVIKARAFEAVSLELSENSDFVAMTYKSDEPISKTGIHVEESSIALLGAVFGYSQRVGVLYLEIPELVFSGSEQQHQLHLRALAITLTDLLRLG